MSVGSMAIAKFLFVWFVVSIPIGLLYARHIKQCRISLMSSSYESYDVRREMARAAAERHAAATSNLPQWGVAFNGYDRHGNYQRGNMTFRAIDADAAAKMARQCKPSFKQFNVIVTLVNEEVQP